MRSKYGGFRKKEGLDPDSGQFVGKSLAGIAGEVGPYFRGTYMLDREAPIPGVPWTTFWLVIANSPRKCPIISGLISIATNSLPECNCNVKSSISGMMIISLAWVFTGSAFRPPFPFSLRD